MAWLDTLIIGVIIVVGLFIMYRALKEPLDLLFGLIGRGLGAIRDKIVDWREGGVTSYDEIKYG